jgi:NAD(P)H-flavin reductase
MTGPVDASSPAGAQPSARVVLAAMQDVLRQSISSVGGPESLVRGLVAQLAEKPDAIGGSRPGVPGSAAPTMPLAQLRAVLPTGPAAQRDTLTQALGWLVDNLDRPMVVTEGCTQLGPVLTSLGIPPDRIEATAILVAETMRADVGAGWRAEQHEVWSRTSRLVARWIAHGGAAAGYQPPVWAGRVVEHHLHRQDLAVLRIRTFLPYPYLPGQYATAATEHQPQSWRPCWIAAAPRLDNIVELHVRAESPDRVGMALVGRVGVGDRLRLGPARGALVLDPASDRDLLLIADDTGVAPMRALVDEVRQQGGGRRIHLWWKVPPGEDPYDRTAVSALEGPATSVRLVRTMAELSALLDAPGPWQACDVCVAGTRTGVAAAQTLLAYAGVARERIRSAHLGWDG